MQLKVALLCVLILSPMLNAKTVNDIDTRSVEWLLSQINIGEAQKNKRLIEDSLKKLVAIAPTRIETQCAQAHYNFVNGDLDGANQLLSKLDNGLIKQPLALKNSKSCLELKAKINRLFKKRNY
ncbi:hypothetical protein P4S71_14465 [Pseudoalteromonas sp. B62]